VTNTSSSLASSWAKTGTAAPKERDATAADNGVTFKPVFREAFIIRFMLSWPLYRF
jgi:hypothetical protein